ncbi:MAG: NAD(P)-dependent oxidoreductase [Alphaproteobacteria bacterium]
MSKNILVTPRSLSQGEHVEFEPLIQAGFKLITPTPGLMPSEADLLDVIGDCVGWLAGVEPISDAVIHKAQYLKVISRNGTGIDNLPMELLKEHNIAIERAIGTNARGVAELALAFIVSGLRYIIPTHEGIRNGEWPRMRGREICDSTIGIIGLGSIGKIVGELCLALGAKVIGYDPYVHHVINHASFEQVDFMDAIKCSDIISLHCPMAEDGRPIITKEVLAMARPELIIVNTARAGLVDEEALLEALNKRSVSNYMADVFHEEPPKSSLLTQNPFVAMTSHIGGFTDSSVSRSTKVAVANILKHFS